MSRRGTSAAKGRVMKRLIAAALLLFSTPCLAAIPLGGPPPAMSREDALDLENVQLKLAAIQRQLEDIARASKELAEHRDALLKKYELNVGDRVSDDGGIHRTEKAPDPKPAPKIPGRTFERAPPKAAPKKGK